jgi:endogenous inhibitor of DNA gyrase (YacG/DUF329 family)
MRPPGRPKSEYRRAKPEGNLVGGDRVVPCPACKQPAQFGPANRWRPFCSERCRSFDLGAWATESYRVAAETPPDAENPPPAAH